MQYINLKITIFLVIRPISLLPQFSKVLEKLFNIRILNFINENNVLFDGQYGFRQNFCTEMAVVEVIDKITDSIESKKHCIGIFIDLKKAFDTSNHEILIGKLKYYGIRGIASKWKSSYLTNRKQFVYYNNIYSDTEYIKCGVPQGSILGPTLFYCI